MTMAEADAWVIIPRVKNKGTECILDMRPLVLCKECKHYSEGECRIKAGWFHVEPDWFCADGEE